MHHDDPRPPPRARCVMVLGTTSGAGKSWLATALCRHYARQGWKVAAFKAQNMSNNARVVGPAASAAQHPGGEIGSAQYFQALAARAVPDVRMNPVLLKPERDTHSQVVVLGQVDAAMTAMPWRARSAQLWPVVAGALDALRAENDVVVIEGAGSPAEINLADCDFVNMRVAAHAQAACLLVTDIDRGGAFAHLYGTWALLAPAHRALIRGFVLNKFRGDASLLAPGPALLAQMTGVPVVATVPMWWQHGLPEEDGVMDVAPTLGTDVSSLPPGGALAPRGGPSAHWAPTLGTDVSSLPPEGALAPRGGPSALRPPPPGTGCKTVAVLAYPRISNLDEFQPLRNVPGVRLRWVRSAAQLAGLARTDWVVLPGSKHTSADLAWLRAQGLDAAVAAHAAAGGAVLGVCGGLQMLGEALIDPHGIDGNAPGLGLLPLVTVFARDKTVRAVHSAFGAVHGPWQALSGLAVQGYEIHHGQTAPHPAMLQAGAQAHAAMPGALAWQNGAGNVLGLYLHGLFENAAVLQALFGATTPTLDSVFEGLADCIERHFDAHVLQGLLR